MSRDGRRGRPVVVVSRGVGRLCNRLVLYAHLIAAAIEHDLVVVNPAFAEYAHLFPRTAGDLLCRYPPARGVPAPRGTRRPFLLAVMQAAKVLDSLQRSGRDVGLIRLRRDQFLDLDGPDFRAAVERHRVLFLWDWYFRSTELCHRHRDAVRAFLTPGEEHLARGRAAVEPARRRGRFLIGVHVRRTDYRLFKGGAYFYSLEQYRRLMEQAQAAFPDRDVSFLVCSDETLSAEPFPGLDVIRGNGEMLGDLLALAACDRLLGPPSTYSGWASFYGDVPRHVIADPGEAPTPESFVVHRGLGGPPAGARPWTPPRRVPTPSGPG